MSKAVAHKLKQVRVFISYRQGAEEGDRISAQLFQSLHDGILEINPENPIRLDLYWDRRAPAVHDFRNHLLPRLRASHAFILVCSPGVAVRRADEDYLYDEIDWWLKNRRTGPILVLRDVSDTSVVPRAILEKYPRAQRIEWSESHPEIAIERIREGIALSEQGYRYEEIARLRFRNRLLVAALLLLLFLASGLYWALGSAREARAEAQAQLYHSTLLAARDSIASNRVAEGAALLGSLGEEQVLARQESALVLGAWMSRLLSPQAATARLGQPVLVSWRGQNIFRHGNGRTLLLPIGEVTWWQLDANHSRLFVLYDQHTLHAWDLSRQLLIDTLFISDDVHSILPSGDLDLVAVYISLQSSYAGGASPGLVIWQPRKSRSFKAIGYEVRFEPQAGTIFVDSPETLEGLPEIEGLEGSSPLLVKVVAKEESWVTAEVLDTDQLPENTGARLWELTDFDASQSAVELSFPSLREESSQWSAQTPSVPSQAHPIPRSAEAEDFWRHLEQLGEGQDMRGYEEEELIELISGIFEAAEPESSCDDLPSDFEKLDCEIEKYHGAVSYLERTYLTDVVKYRSSAVLRSWHSAGSKYGELCFFKVNKAESPKFFCDQMHGNAVGLVATSPDGRYYVLSDFQYMGHESFRIIDIESVSQVTCGETPLGWGPAQSDISFDSESESIAIITRSREVWQYEIDRESASAALLTRWPVPARLIGADPWSEEPIDGTPISIKWLDGRHFLLADSEKLIRYDRESSAILWEASLGFVSSGPPSLAFDRLTGVVAAFSNNAAKIFSLENGIAITQTILLDDLYVSANLEQIDEGSDETNWGYPESVPGIQTLRFVDGRSIEIVTDGLTFEHRLSRLSDGPGVEWSEISRRTGYTLAQPLLFTADVAAELMREP